MRAEQTSFLFGANAPFIEELYERYLADPNAVDAEWRTFSAPSIPTACRLPPTAM